MSRRSHVGYLHVCSPKARRVWALTDTRSSGIDRDAREDVNTSALSEGAVICVRLLTCRIGRAFSRPLSLLCGSARLGAQSRVRTARPVSASRAGPRLFQAPAWAL